MWSQEVCGGCFSPWAFLFSLAVLGLVPAQVFLELQCVALSWRWLLSVRSVGSQARGLQQLWLLDVEHRLSTCSTWA